MLTKNPMTRMVKLSQVRSHIWFKVFNWEDLDMLNMIPPYKPIMKKDRFEKKEDDIFVDYVKDLKDSHEDDKGVKINDKMRMENDESLIIFNNFRSDFIRFFNFFIGKKLY